MTEHHKHIPLNKLTAWDGNVRKTAGADTALAELAASIAAHGLLQSLVVRKDKRGKYAVVAGRRRLLALSSLVQAGKIEADIPVACHVIGEDQSAAEVSLAENVVREPMHPADEFEAFRESEISLEEVMAFAVSDDHAAQERIWSEAPPWMRSDARAIREALTENDIAASDRRVKFVGLKAYEKAGGAVRRDLFSEGDGGVFILDAGLLSQIAATKLEKTAKAIRKEGWKWVEIHPDFGYAEAGEFQRHYPERLPLSDEEAAELATLEQEADASYDIEGELSNEQQARFDVVTQRMEDLTDNREEIWPAETLSIAGAVVGIGRDGEAEITRGLIRSEDAPKKEAKAKANGSTAIGVATLPASLLQSLTEHKSAALSAAMIERPDIALAAVVHLFASRG